jgi:hypothetical protein
MPVTADTDLALVGGLLVTWLPARVSRSPATDEYGAVLLSESHKPTFVGYAAFCGLDVGKGVHHACALDPGGTRLYDRPLPNDEAALREVLSELSGHRAVPVIVDQPASIGALAIAVARSLGIDVAYLPGLAMRRIADLHPGKGKTDARDAYVIADAARSMPHTLRQVGTDEYTLAGLTVLAGDDDNFAGPCTRLSNRLRDALLHIHPSVDHLLGKAADWPPASYAALLEARH